MYEWESLTWRKHRIGDPPPCWLVLACQSPHGQQSMQQPPPHQTHTRLHTGAKVQSNCDISKMGPSWGTQIYPITTFFNTGCPKKVSNKIFRLWTLFGVLDTSRQFWTHCTDLDPQWTLLDALDTFGCFWIF